MRDIEKRSTYLNRELIKFAVLGYGITTKKKDSQKNTNVRPLLHAVLKLECTLCHDLGLSRLEIYIKISPGTVMSLEYLAEVNRKSLCSDTSTAQATQDFIGKFPSKISL